MTAASNGSMRLFYLKNQLKTKLESRPPLEDIGYILDGHKDHKENEESEADSIEGSCNFRGNAAAADGLYQHD